ncbi:hypothetical protein BASA81_003262 [Batrachochytrium salamandrivorans]|nr:hypothetical protein BASA81_003262 [Batrachochytrium salamandrivorans]
MQTLVLRDGRQLAYYTTPPSAPTSTADSYVLLLHGMTESSTIFRSKRSPCHHLVCLDRPGYGLSSPPPSESYSYHTFAEDVLELLAGAGIAKLEAVLGHSSGGPCALAVATYLGPTKVDKCVLVASDVEYCLGLVPDPLPHPVLDVDADCQDVAKGFGFTTARERSLAEVDLADYRDSVRRNPRGNAGAIHDHLCERRPWGFAFSKDLDELENRLVVVYGELDPYITKAHAEVFQRLGGGNHPVCVHGYGHFDILLDPTSFNLVLNLV